MKIIVEGISKELNHNIVLKNIFLNLKGGNIYGFVGRNGSGKSILFKTICGFIRPDVGKVIIDDIDIYNTNTFPNNTGASIEKPTFLGDLSGFENLKLLATIRNIISDEDIINTLKEVNLYEEKDKKFKHYSLGMKQKLGIAQALMENPDIIILDEPFNGLDESSAVKIRNILLERKKAGKLILIATHIKEDTEILCDYVYRMDDGKIEDSY